MAQKKKNHHKRIASVLRSVIRLIDKPSRWIQYGSAADKNGKRVPIRDPRAVKFCVSGACRRIVQGRHMKVNDAEVLIMDVHDFLAKRLRASSTWCYVAAFNDDLLTKHTDVMKFLNESLNVAETK